jgi:hypothetical protein
LTPTSAALTTIRSRVEEVRTEEAHVAHMRSRTVPAPSHIEESP